MITLIVIGRIVAPQRHPCPNTQCPEDEALHPETGTRSHRGLYLGLET